MWNIDWKEFTTSMLVGACFGAGGYFLTKYIVAAIDKTEGRLKVG